MSTSVRDLDMKRLAQSTLSPWLVTYMYKTKKSIKEKVYLISMEDDIQLFLTVEDSPGKY